MTDLWSSPGGRGLDIAAVAHLDRAVADVERNRDRWRSIGAGARAALLRECIATTYQVAQEWVAADAADKHFPADAPVAALEWTAGPYFVIRTMRLYAESMRSIDRAGAPRPPGPVRVRHDGRLSVGVSPSGYDRALYPGYSVETWLPAGTSPDDVDQQMAGAYRVDAPGAGRVCVVLGAGNISSLAPNDALYALFVKNDTVVLKLSPVLTYQRDILARAFAPLISAGFLRLVPGGPDVATYLVHHDLVDDVLLTGSLSTYDAIVFGTGPEGAKRKAEDRPLLEKPVLAELGSVTPVIVVPGPWRSRDVRYHAENVASNLAVNAGSTCVTPRILVTHRQWPLRDRFLDELRKALARTPTRYPYYPGSREKYAAYLAAYPDAERLGTPAKDHLPWLLQTGVEARDGDQPAFVEDPFCGILSETALDVRGSVTDFLGRVTEFANERLFGTLNAVVFVDPRTRRDARDAFDRCLVELEYGNVVLNAGPALPYLNVTPPWGAYPGRPRNSLRSGTGFVHNTYLLDNPEKSVVRAPFHARPKPPWFTSHRHPLETFRAATALEAEGGLGRLTKAVWHDIRP